MRIAVEAGVVLLLVLVNALFALGEIALVSANRARLAVLARKGVKGAAQALALADQPARFLPAVQLGITLIGILIGAIGVRQSTTAITVIFARLGVPAPGSVALGLVVVVVTYVTMVLGELVPKQLALRDPEHLAAWTAPPLAMLARSMLPAIWLLDRSSALVLRAFGGARVRTALATDEELKALLAEGAETGALEVEERDIIERVLRLADKPVRAIMTPRTEIVWIDRTDPAREIAAALKASPHGRFVVCDGSVDAVVGVVQSKDILDLVLDGREPAIDAVLRQPKVVPDTLSALDALMRLRADPVGLALVLDEYGSFEGIVTAGDVLEAIVGSARQVLPIQGAAPEAGPLDLDGLAPIDEVKARLDLPDLPDAGSYHTLAGLLLALLRRVPRAGDRIAFGGWLFEVTEMDGRRAARVRVRREGETRPAREKG